MFSCNVLVEPDNLLGGGGGGGGNLVKKTDAEFRPLDVTVFMKGRV
jgi:hypothetical protein